MELAERQLAIQIQKLKTAKNYDSLVNYVLPLGRIEIQSKNTITSANSLADEIIQNSSASFTRSKLNIELSKLYFELGEPGKAFSLADEANKLAKKTTDEQLLINSEYYLGDYALRTGNIEALETHIRSANKRIENKKGTPYYITARVLNLMGTVMFFSTKQDSAEYYFENALKYISNLEEDVENKFYLPAAISGNLFVIKSSNGQHDEALKHAQNSLRLNQEFLIKAPNHHQTPRVKSNMAISFINLSSIYFDLGDFDRADKIMSLAYTFANTNFETNRDEYFYVLLGLAEVKTAKREFALALHFLEKAEACLDAMPEDNQHLRAYLYTDFGNNAYETKSFEKALSYYEKSDGYYERFNPGTYDSNRLHQTMNLGMLNAELGFGAKAIEEVTAAYNYIKKENGWDNYQTNLLLIAMAKIHLALNDYEKAILWCDKSLEIYKKNEQREGSEKIFFEAKKAKVILLKARAEYALQTDRNTSFLKKLTNDLGNGMEILEAKKSVITSPESINVLLENNKEVFDFAKKINLELFEKTNDLLYLSQAVSLHESALYNKIRIRLNINKNRDFNGVPKVVILRENELRDQLNNISQDNEGSISPVETLIKSKENWTSFLDTLKQNYPKYYKMRYATIGESLNNIEKRIPENTTVVRYFYIEETLNAFVVSKNGQKLFKLDTTEVEECITALGENQSQLEQTSSCLDKLYTKLWKPFADEIKTENVIIIPDGTLYNLSFETLTPKKIKSYKELSNNSLLARYNISYNYSLYLIDNSVKQKIIENSFIAFAPEFNDKMKENYKLAVTDSLNLDKTYLTLLQQPFNANLAKTYSSFFDGDFFMNENSTETIFKKKANEHKIIHIGTHAESNNISPELSRLIFAKDIFNSSSEDGSLYTYEIYNTSLNSNLAILTACETGKPSYQAGEGMISLAHAFNYAGSESILTSLWNIDERSSAEIVELFYENIMAGKPKDEALRLAKLEYIKINDGRTIAPQYWAGLVLMGDTAPIKFTSGTPWWLWFIGFGILFMVFLLLRGSLGKS
tara:strand:+ start:4079 stop:7177 length:3099 start_codon:yes stop_codon:yes gene_type:complete